MDNLSRQLLSCSGKLNYKATAISSGTANNLFGVIFGGSNSVIFSGQSGFIGGYDYGASTLTSYTSNTANTLYSLGAWTGFGGLGTLGISVAGDAGTLDGYSEGTSWTIWPGGTGTSSNLRAYVSNAYGKGLSYSSGGTHLILGASGTLRRAPNSNPTSGSTPTFSAMTSGTSGTLYAAIKVYNSATSANGFVIVGTSYLAYLDDTLTAASSITSVAADLRCVSKNFAVGAAGQIIAAGVNGSAYSIDPYGGSASSFSLPTTATINGITGPYYAGEPWVAVGTNGTILMTYDQTGTTGWFTVASGTTQSLNAVCGTTSSNRSYYVVGNAGTLIRLSR